MSLLILTSLLIVAQSPSVQLEEVPTLIPTDQACDTRNTTEGNCCAFPFTFNGTIYYDCITKDKGREWCSLDENYEKYGAWGYCETQTAKPIFDSILKATGTNGRSLDGVDLFQGDIVMTSEIRDSLRSRGILVPGDNPRSLLPQDWGSKPQRRPKRALINTRRTDLRWPVGRSGKREVPYQITRSNYNVRGVIERAMNHWMERVRCLRFVRKTSSHRRYLSFFSGGGCYSMVGRQPGSGAQKISIGNGCGSLGVVAHEIGHALGLWHEQSRPDRDSYVTINWNNIQQGMAYNFHKYGSERIDSRGVSYDYDSIMHYSSTAFANRAGAKTIVGKNGRTNLGQRYGLSKKDIQQANLLYCGASPAVTKPPPKPTPHPSACQYRDKHHNCPYWEKVGYCTRGQWQGFMKTNCRRSCFCKGTTPCKDNNRYCTGWKRYCDHARFQTYMSTECKKTCNNC